MPICFGIFTFAVAAIFASMVAAFLCARQRRQYEVTGDWILGRPAQAAVPLALLLACVVHAWTLFLPLVTGSAAQMFTEWPYGDLLSERRFVDLLFDADYVYAAPRRVKAASLPDDPSGRVLALRSGADLWSDAFEVGLFTANTSGNMNDAFGLDRDPETKIVSYVHRHSPAEAAGIRRGYRLIDIDRSKSPPEVEVLDLANQRHALRLTPTSFKKESVRHRVIMVGGRPVGYLWIASFMFDARDALDAAFADFNRERVRDLIVDLRDNNGGNTNYSDRLLDLALGRQFPVSVAYRISHRGEKRVRDHGEYLFPRWNALPALDSATFLTSPYTCSASEIAIETTAQFVPITTIGGPTCGKQVVFEPVQRGAYVYELATARVEYPRSRINYDGGIPAGLPVEDSYAFDQWDDRNPLLAAAIARYRRAGHN